MKTSIVLGMLYGDEGKGQTASFLSNNRTLIVRFNGGCQAGHTVVKNGYRHVFSSFGSGTMNGAHTYWSEYCTFYPKSFYNEQRRLREEGFKPVHFIHPMAPVTTPFDIDHNRQTEDINKHGSVGMGFGATIARNENTPYKLYTVDLQYREVLVHKLKQIASYYKVENPEEDINNFLKYVDAIKLNIITLSEIKDYYGHIVFEGAQGIMLDMDFGFFPNVTRSNTTSKNAMKIIVENKLPVPEIYYCMRSYLTRHGNGYMPNEDENMQYEDQTNYTKKYQGKFRQGWHSIEQINHVLRLDNIFTAPCTKHLSICCLDQTNERILIDGQHETIEKFISRIERQIENIIVSSSTDSEKMLLIPSTFRIPVKA